MNVNFKAQWTKFVRFINRQPTWLLTTIAVISLIINYLTDGYVKLFFLGLCLVTILISLTRSIKQSVKDHPIIGVGTDKRDH
jgi:uncharacterized membrane protein